MWLSNWRKKRQAARLQKELAELVDAVSKGMKEDPDSPVVKNHLKAIETLYATLTGDAKPVDARPRPQPTRGSE